MVGLRCWQAIITLHSPIATFDERCLSQLTPSPSLISMGAFACDFTILVNDRIHRFHCQLWRNDPLVHLLQAASLIRVSYDGASFADDPAFD
jgi:hypothetical protein